MPIAEVARKSIADLQAPTGRGVDALERRLFQRLQALEDAIAYRRARAAAPCPVCEAAPGQCDDHGRDVDLIAAYQRTHHQTSARLRAIRRPGPVLAGGPSDGGS
jgi:hypothetical protein